MRKRVTRLARLLFGLTSATVAWAQIASQAPHPFAPGSCGPVDSTYIRVAEDTGGIPFFFQRSEVAQSTKLMLFTSGQNQVTLLWAKGQAKSKELVVPVDSSLEQVTFEFSATSHDSKMEVFGPNDVAMTEIPSAETTDFTCGRFVVLKHPIPGNYRIRIEGTGQYWLSVAGKSNIFLSRVEFVELGGRPGHQGMFPIHGQPLVGKSANFEASVTGNVRAISFFLVTPEDRPIASLNLRARQNQDDENDFAGQFSLPSEPFRVMATGIDQNGMSFERMHGRLFRPTTISLVLTAQEAVAAGVSSALTFEVKNLGNPDTFALRAVCASRWPAELDPAVVSLGQGEIAKVVVTVAVPEGTPAYTSSDLVLTASSQSDPSITNGVVHHLSIQSRK
jgi:von Willebrand factor A domain-containing protein 7